MARVKHLDDFDIDQKSSPNIGATMSDHRGLVVHVAEGTYLGTINWQLNPTQKYADGTKVTTSSTWIVGRNPGEVTQMVDSDTVAWCQRAGSLTWNSVELAGTHTQNATDWQIKCVGALLYWLHKTYGVPLSVANTPADRGLGHHSMDREAIGEEWGHEDCPGLLIISQKLAMVNYAKKLQDKDQAMQDSSPVVHLSSQGIGAIWTAEFGRDENRHQPYELLKHSFDRINDINTKLDKLITDLGKAGTTNA